MFKALFTYPRKFIAQETSSGIITILAAFLALAFANSPYHSGYLKAQNILGHGVNDGLMILFFLTIALELKKEMFGGMLADSRQIILPLIAATGGMVVPALIYVQLNTHSGGLNGWAIPTATDIAFALSILLIAGKGLPQSLKIFLLAIAIFDDLGAIIIIAMFYTEQLSLMPLGFAVIVMAVLYMMNKSEYLSVKVYLLLGAILAFLLYKAGVHTTIAGVITGFMIPTKKNQKLMHELHPISAFAVVPVFAFVNAGVSFEGINFDSLFKPVTLGIALGLFVGKQIGIFGATFIAVKLKIAKLPDKATWLDIHAISVIAGVGFTMSLFIGLLAFSNAYMQDQVKIGVLVGSFLSAFFGMFLLRLRKKLHK